MLNRSGIFIMLSWISVGIISPASALPSDQNQPLHIFAQTSHIDRLKGTNILSGQVKLQQGTSILLADRVILYTDKHNELQKAIAQGNPVHYVTTISATRGNFLATAQQMEYLPLKNVLVLEGNATAIQGPNSYTAPKIEYYINQDTLISPRSSHGRTTIIILPNSLKGNSARE